MGFLIVNFVLVAVLGVLVLVRGRDRRADRVRLAGPLRIAGLVPLGLQAAIFALFGVGEMLGGDLSGAGHLLQLAVVGLLGFLVWLRPLEGGAALVLGSLIGLVTFLGEGELISGNGINFGMLILAAPLALAGILSLSAGVAGIRAGGSAPDQAL